VIRALVTGCAGFVGSHLVESLLGDGHAVHGVDCFNDNYDGAEKRANLAPAHEHDDFRLTAVDLGHADAGALLADCDVVFHLAAEPGVRSSWGKRFDRYLHNNVSATQRLLEASKRTPERRFVYASSSSVYGHAAELPTREDATPKPFSPYGVTKLAAEQLCRLYHANHGVDTVALRFFTVYGPRQRPDMAFTRFVRAGLTGEPINVFGTGEQIRDFTYVEDIVSANVLAATSACPPGSVLNVSGGSNVSLNEALAILERVVGRDLQVVRHERTAGDVFRTGGDASRALELLGWRPQVSLEEGLGEQAAWMRALLAGT
jgi:UDP-glucuronate 4-epimerase